MSEESTIVADGSGNQILPAETPKPKRTRRAKPKADAKPRAKRKPRTFVVEKRHVISGDYIIDGEVGTVDALPELEHWSAMSEQEFDSDKTARNYIKECGEAGTFRIQPVGVIVKAEKVETIKLS